MLNKKDSTRVLFNDSHSNLPNSSSVPQGGVSSFADKFTKYFGNEKREVRLISILFSHNSLNSDIFIKKTTNLQDYYELCYPREILGKSYSKKYTKKKYIKFLNPLLKKVVEIIELSNPDIIFLNGFSLSNWLIMEAAYIKKIPVCIQHAGIWKMELKTSKDYFSPSVKKIFSSFEKDIFKKTKIQIFLNEFSRVVFFDLHNINKNKKNFSKTIIIPLPIEVKKVNKIKINKTVRNIGVVARWDRIKNHDAILRLAKYINNNNLSIKVNVVTKWDEKNTTIYREKYKEHINLVEPMHKDKLSNFYLNQDVVLIPSRFDVSPTVFMESIILGKPVIISSSVGWISDYKKYGLSKLIIKPTSSGKIIYNTIISILSNDFANNFTKLQKKIISYHNSNAVFNEYSKIFTKIK